MIVGVVGKPNVGKSTFFRALTLAEAESANYPFVTIKPNVGVGHVRLTCASKDFDTVSNPREGYILGHERFVPVKVIDVAGLVPGAHEGKGLGNQFLDDLRQADVLVHVIDIAGSTNEKGEPVDAGSYDPANDILFLEKELDHWFANILQKVWVKASRAATQEKVEAFKVVAKQLSGLGITEDLAKEAITHCNLQEKPMDAWTEEILFNLCSHLRKLAKPMIIAANKIDMPQGEENLKRLQEQFKEYTIIGCSAESELALKEAHKHDLISYVPGDNTFEMHDESKLSDKQKKALNFIKEHILAKYGSSGVQHIMNAAVFDLLKYIAIFPGGANKLADKDGNVLPDCFLLPPESTALDFAASLHTDFAKHFVKAIDVRTKQAVGKDHKLKHRDVIEIMANT